MKNLFIAGVAALLLSSCSKTDSSPSAVLQYQINNATYRYTIVTDTLYSGGSLIQSSIYAPLNALSPSVLMQITATGSIQPGNYADTGSFSRQCIVSMQDFSGVVYSTANCKHDPFFITVSSDSSGRIQGSFHGDLYLNGDSTQAMITLFNGVFNITEAN